uniref:Immediate early response 3-interacting protein 1 n=1 Tax=Cyprinus carpio carpio TaxID=630221 RepID=A0A9J8A4V9_CYPCA
MPSRCFTKRGFSVKFGSLGYTIMEKTADLTVVQKTIIDTLHREVGWGAEQSIGGFGDEPGIKAQLLNLIRSVRTVMRVPLIAVNSVCIVLLLLFG